MIEAYMKRPAARRREKAGKVHAEYLISPISEPAKSLLCEREEDVIMDMKKTSFSKLFGRLFAGILVLFLISVPLLYAALFVLPLDEAMQPLLYTAIRAFRFLLAVLIAFSLRKTALLAFADNKPHQKRITTVLLLLAAVSLWLRMIGAVPLISTAYLIAVFNLPAFWVILWEEFFEGHFYWTALLSLIILYVRLPAAGRGRAVQAG